MRRTAQIAAAAALVLASGAVHALQMPSGEVMQRICESDQPYDKGFCAGFLSGVVSAQRDAQAFCRGGRYLDGAFLASLFAQYARLEPDSLHEPAADLALRMLAREFPC